MKAVACSLLPQRMVLHSQCTLHVDTLPTYCAMLATQLRRLQYRVHDQDHRIGHLDAPFMLVEYGDYQCPRCLHAESVLAAVRAEFGSQVCFVFRNFPLTKLHPHALHAAEASEIVATHGGAAGYWSMHDLLFAHQLDSAEALDDAHLARYASSVGIDPDVFTQTLRARTYEAQVRSEFLGGIRSGVAGTPTFFMNGTRFLGDWSHLPTFLTALSSTAPSSVNRLMADH